MAIITPITASITSPKNFFPCNIKIRGFKSDKNIKYYENSLTGKEEIVYYSHKRYRRCKYPSSVVIDPFFQCNKQSEGNKRCYVLKMIKKDIEQLES